jgi:hypothetical protein
MTKIIKNGKKQKGRKFCCGNCGCLFKTTDFRTRLLIEKDLVGCYVSYCPNCSIEVIS